MCIKVSKNIQVHPGTPKHPGVTTHVIPIPAFGLLHPRDYANPLSSTVVYTHTA